MKVRISHILIGLLFPLLSSCISTDIDEQFKGIETAVQVKLSVDVKAPVATKGLDTVDPTSLMVLAYRTDGTFVKELPVLKVSRNDAGKVEFLCAFDIMLPENASAANAPEYKFMVLSNSTNQQYGLSYDKNGKPAIETLDFKYPFQNTVPMWGVKTYQFQYGEDGKPLDVQNLGQVDVLRSAAKVGVKLDDAVKEEGFTIEEIKINYVAGSGYSVPLKWNEVASTALLNNTEGFRPAPGAVLSNVNAFKDSQITEGMKYIYIPEIANEEELAMSITLRKGEEVFEFPYEKGIKFCTYVEGQPTDDKFNVVRNHFYDYTITAVHTNIELELIEYETLPFIEEEVEIGGEVKYLVLNTDLVKIYSENVDETTLKFTSSSPIASVELKDVYSHNSRDGKFEKGSDAVSAYYVGKFGQKTQLGTDPGFPMADKKAALDKELVILDNISAVAEQNVLQGGITITSPFMAEPDNEIAELQGDSHYDTVRYLEFEVTNQQGLTEIFRVMQYPPLTITNVEGYFSYRDDFRIGDLQHTYDITQFSGSYPGCMVMPMDNGEAIHYHNPLQPFFVLASFFPYHVHEWDPVTNRMIKTVTQPSEGFGTCPTVKTYAGFEEVICGLMERDYMRVDEYKGGPVSGVFHRTHYLWNDGTAFVGANIGKPANYYQNVGPVYEKQHEVNEVDPETGEVIGTKTITKYYRRHYTGDSFNVFYSKFIELPINSDGTAVIGTQRCDYNYTAPWYMWSVWYPNGNHRMYHIRTNTTSSEYIVGRPKMMTVDGRVYTAEGEGNSRMVSPSFMIASMLGETRVPYDRGDGYIVPKEGGLYPIAQRQCEQYVETTFEDTNNNGIWEEGEPVTHYDNWRLPTKAEIELIAKYQNNSRAIDNVLTGQTYYCASIVEGSYSAETVLSDPIEGAAVSGYYMRCVRDVYED